MRKLFVHDALDNSFHFGISKLRLGLALELRLWNFNGNDNRQSFAEIIAGERNFIGLDKIVLRRVIIHRPRERRFESRNMRPSFMRVNIVDVGKKFSFKPSLYSKAISTGVASFSPSIKTGLCSEIRVRSTCLQNLYAALRIECLFLIRSLVFQRNRNLWIKKRKFKHTLAQHVHTHNDGLSEYLGVRSPANGRAGIFGFADHFYIV